MKQEVTNKYKFAKTLIIIYTLIWTMIVPVQTLASYNYLQTQAKTVSPHQNTPLMPNLNGEKAEEYLKDNGLYESLGDAMQAARYSINWINKSPVSDTSGAFEAKNPNNAYTAYFQEDSVHLVSKNKDDDWRLQMKLKGFGYGKDISLVKTEKSEVKKDKARIEINKSAINNPQSKIVEWYENKKQGLEQGWTLNERPQGNSDKESLSLVLEIGGNLETKLAKDKQSLILNKQNNKGSISYEKLKAWDANGKDVSTRMELSGKELTLIVEDIDAVYPLTIDPVFTQIRKISASDADDGDRFGSSVSIDGDTIVIGAETAQIGANNNQGAAYVFSRNMGGSNMWGQVTKLTASNGVSDNLFGTSVAISGDRIVIGAKGFNNFKGAAYIFERNQGGVDNWGEIKILFSSDGNASNGFGISIAISNNQIVVGTLDSPGRLNNREGSAHIFERNHGGLDNWGEVKKIFSSDGQFKDKFGLSVAIDKDTIVVGADQHDIVTNPNQGAAYVFRRNQGGTDNWGEITKLTATNGNINDGFGHQVSISNDTIVVGARIAGGVANDREGAAYIFERNQIGINSWGLVKKIFSADGSNSDNFGISVSIDNDTIVVGSVLNSSSYIFERNQDGSNNWGELKKLTVPSQITINEFGFQVGISGDMVVTTARRDSLNNNSDEEGSAYIFRTDNLNWVETSRSLASDGTDFDQFGISVSISGDTAIVGASNDEIGGNQFQGSAYIFQRNTNGADLWGQVAKLTSSNGGPGDEFGHSVSIDGDRAVVGAYQHDFGGTQSNQGSAYIFERNQGGTADNWGEARILNSANATSGDQLGISVSISGDTVIVGANRDDVSGRTAQGSAYIFSRNQGFINNWGEVKNIVATDGTSSDQFGTSVAISGDTVIVGAPLKDIGTDFSAGAAYIFERNQGGTADNWGEVKKIIDSPVQSASIFGQSVSIDNDTVIIGSPLYDSFIQQNIGSASIYERNTGGVENWGFVDFVLASVRNDDDEFGTSVSIDNDQVIVGSPFADVNGNNNQGAAYIFERNRDGLDAWGEFKKLTASTGSGFDQFGISVAINRNQVAIGANRTDISSPLSQIKHKSNKNSFAGSDQGAAFVFRANPFAPTAASVSVGGKVLDVNGRRGLPRTIVTLTDSSGERRTTRTNQFGNYRFEDIAVGDTYTISAFSKGYEFQTQVVNLIESITNLNIRPISTSNSTKLK